MSYVASVIIPARNESEDIVGCLEAIAAQDVGAGSLEVLVADGCSEDDTAGLTVVAAATHGFGRFEIVANPGLRASAGLRRALDSVTSPYVVRVDARSRIGPDHIRRAIEVLEARPAVGVVGGAQVPVDRGTTTVASGISRALGNRFTTGLSRYRRSSRSGPTDTVWMGAFRADDLRELGGWDPSCGINEDYELNSRFRQAGFVVWFDAELAAGYLPRTTLGGLGRQYFAFGRAKGRQWGSGGIPAPRQVVLIAAPVALSCGATALRRLAGRRAAVAGVLATAFAADHLGARQGASLSVRGASVVSTATFAGSWWVGTVVGLAETLRRADIGAVDAAR